MTPPPEAGAPPPLKPSAASMNDHSDKHLDQKRRKLGFVEPPKGFGADYFFYRFLPREHILRRWCVQIVSHNYFDRFIIAAIVANSVILGLSDFSVVDKDLNPASSGKKYEEGGLVDAYSLQNHIVEISESPFTIIFTTECVLKIISMGLYGKGSYFKDTWNILDFFVVVSSLVASLPGMPNVSAIRTIRVLRPLRSLSVIPGMRRLIAALLKALPALGNVVILQIFVFFIFGILGIQLFGGSMNRRCRLTSQPVKLPLDDMNEVIWPVPSTYLDEVQANEVAYICLDADLLDYEDSTNYTKETSPWNTPQNCFWPVDEKDESLCAASGQPGNHNCKNGMFCGSDYDAFGNPRFSHKKAMGYALYRPSLDWGLTTFDNIGYAFFTIFQSITQEGWTAIMYMVMDSSQPTIGAIFFVVLIIFASFFVMNLTLAVISEEFNLDQKPGKTAAEKREEERKAKLEREKAEKKAREHWLNAIVSHRLFSGFIMCVILANTGILAMDHYPMPTKMDEDLEIVNFALSCVFVVEMIMKLFGLGLRQYSRDKFNLFDAFIVTMGILEMIASPPSFMSSNPPKKGAVSALRSFRLFRVFKLARDWKSLRELLEMIIRAVASITNFGVLLFLFIYIYALVGVQFFGNTMRFDDEGYPTPFNLEEFWNGTVPRNNFDTLLWAAVTVFQIITGENWNSIMYYAILGNGMLSCVYFISLVILGDFVLMNLFLALLLDNFGDNDEEQEMEKQEETKKLAQKMSVMNMSMKVTPITTSESERTVTTRGSFLMVSTAFSLGGRRQSILEMDEEGDEEDVRVVNLERFADELTPSVPLAKTVYIEPPARLTAPAALASPRPLEKQGSLRRKSLRNMMTAARNSIIASSRASVLSTMIMGTGGQPPEEETEEPEEATGPPSPFSPGRSLFLFAADSKVRRVACFMSTHPWFDSIVFTLIVISSIALAVDNPLADPTSRLATFLKGLDKALAIVFAIEMVIKIVAMGLILHKGAYLRNNWNIIDGVIVISSLIMLVAESSGQGKNLKSLRSLRGLRTFRPLRMISRRPGLKLVVNALFEAIPEVINVLFVCMLFFLIFSIVAVNYLKGTFNACSGDVFNGFSDAQMNFLVTPKTWNISSELQRSLFNGTVCELTFPSTTGSDLTSEYVCECWGADWGAVLPQNFNNVGSAMLTFFEISTTEGWADVMMAAIDNNGIGMQPIRDNNMVWALFFVLFILVGSFFVVNLFVGVIIDNFNRMKAALGGDFMLTPEQKKWIEAQKAASRVGPVRILKPPRQYFRRQLFFLVKMQRFEWFIMICIIVNTFLMAAQYFGESTMQAYVINIVNEVFAVIFTLEAVIKLIAFGWEYFEDQWNQFDFFVVLGTLLSVVVELFTGASVRSLAMLVRVFRVTRILRLVKASKSIRQILLTLYIALPGLSNITSILFLMLFIYATMGVQIFAKVALSDNIDEHANFQDFGRGFLFLLRAATGEAWNSCMHDLASSSSGCVDDPPYDPNMCGFNDFEGCKPLNGCGNPIAYAFFCTFTLLVTYVMLNLTIAIILEGFSLSHEDEEPLFEPEILDEFQTKWADIDPKATGFVKVEKMLLLVNLLRPPLGKLGIPFDMAHFFKYMCMLEIPLYEGEYVYFRDVLLAMTREMVKLNAGTISDMPSDQDPGTTGVPGAKRRIEFSAHQYFGARRIQRQVAGWLRIKRKLEKEYMEEYKNKIKKPSGRPKKQRDARVFTVG